VPWYAKALAAGVVGYAFSPIDLIPDFIPVLGYLDELVLLPLGIMAVRAMIPGEILAECRERANRLEGDPRNWIAAAIIAAIWLCLATAAIYWLASRIGWSSWDTTRSDPDLTECPIWLYSGQNVVCRPGP
jgi:uncharacterized membrane protein YkvA (DUF1232 family)